MEFKFSLLSGINLLTAIFMVVLGMVAWRLSRGRGLALWMFAMGEWSLLECFQLGAVGIPAKVFWSVIEYLGTLYGAVFYLLFALEFTGLERFVTRRNILLLCIVPTLTLLLAATNHWHHLIWADFTAIDNNRIIYHRGIAWVLGVLSYTYLLIGIATAFLGWSIFRYPMEYKMQSILLIIGVLCPWSANFLYLTNLSPLPGWDATPVAFSVTGALFFYNLFKYQFYDIRPVARDMLVEKMPSGILVLDSQNRIVDYNSAALCFNSIAGENCLGNTIDTFFPNWDNMLQGNAASDNRLEITQNQHHLELNISALHDPNGHLVGRLLIIRDITERKQIELERERLLTELQQAQTEVQTLCGLLPICSHCKKIRDDSGEWTRMEAYIQSRSDAVFTHTFCPECLEKHYPGFAPKMPQNPPQQ